ncbi:MAG: DUF222 domain-containing protein [Acidimicrobiales bacterium]
MAVVEAVQAETADAPEVAGDLASLQAVLQKLLGGDISDVSDAESVVAIYKARNLLDCLADQACARFDASKEWEADGSRSALAWIAHKTHAPRGVVGASLSNGRALRHLPFVEAAYMAGEITSSHVRVFARSRNDVTEEQLSADEEMLVGQAFKLAHFGQFFRAMAYWSMCADPDGAAKEDKHRRDSRWVSLNKSMWGMYLGEMHLDPLSGEIVSTELERLSEILLRQEHYDGEAPPLRRNRFQRLADALVEMALRSASTPQGSRRPEPLFTVLVGWETLHGMICQLGSGTVLPPSALIPWLECAWLERVVFDSASRPIDVSITQRLYTGATRRAVEVRDQECFHPTCTEPANRCQVDHIEPYCAGGATTTDNGRMACGFHNRARHDKRGPPP